MFRTLADKIPKDNDLPDRAHRLAVLNAVRKGTLYDTLDYPFHQETEELTNKYIPMRNRRPSIRYGLVKILVNDTTGILFGDIHFPSFNSNLEGDPAKIFQTALQRFSDELALPAVMLDAAMRGSVGSIVIRLQVFKGFAFLDVMETTFLTPEYDAENPEHLLKVTEKFKTKGRDLVKLGYTIPEEDLEKSYWCQRVWDDKADTCYVPWLVTEKEHTPIVDAARTVTHSLGFCPLVWVKNLPGGEGVDGVATFADEVIDTSIEIDYQLSQGGRGLKYNSQPTTVIKTDDTKPQVLIAGDAIQVPTEGDAKLLETTGDASKSVIEYVRFLRELALETGGGNRVDASKLSATHSGRAIELMNAGLITVGAKLRQSYGNHGLLSVLKMLVLISNKLDLKWRDGSLVGKLDKSASISLAWPSWQIPTPSDNVENATALATLKKSGLISRETGVRYIAPTYEIEDISNECAAIEKEVAAEQEALLASKSVNLPPKEKD